MAVETVKAAHGSDRGQATPAKRRCVQDEQVAPNATCRQWHVARCGPVLTELNAVGQLGDKVNESQWCSTIERQWAQNKVVSPVDATVDDYGTAGAGAPAPTATQPPPQQAIIAQTQK